MLRIFKNIKKKDWIYFFVAVVFIIGNVFLELKMPDYMSKITMLIETEGSLIKDILYNGLFMLMCAFGSMICTIIVGYFIAKFSALFSLNTRKKLYEKVLSFSMKEIKTYQVSSLITRTTNDVTQLEMALGMGLQLLIKAPLTVIWAVNKIINKSLAFSAITGIAVLISLSTVLVVSIIVMPKFKIIQKLTDKLNGVTRENLTGIKVVRAFNAEKYQESKFDEVNNKLTDIQIFNQKCFEIVSPIMYLVLHLLPLAIYVVGALIINNSVLFDKLTIFSDMVVFTSYATQVIMSFLMIAMIFMYIPRASVSAKRINEVLDEESSILFGKLKEGKEKGVLEFRDVSFKYPDAEECVLEHISFKVQKGETIAFIGSTGSGKSTVVNLILRNYDVTSGEILVNGVNVKEYDKNSLYNIFGYVPQKSVLFGGTVKSNVAFGNSRIKSDKIKDAIKISQAEEFVLKMDNNYDSLIAQSGNNISGGQKQRLSIARAIAKEPQIYIFDDSFSALDYKTDAILRKKLNEKTKEASKIIVASRIGTIMSADKIVVLDEGKCVGKGTHKDLLKDCEIYQKIALSQLSKEELENE